MCKPKQESGTGLKDLIAWNMALLTKNLYKITTNNHSLWSQWFNKEVLEGKSLWDWKAHYKDSKLLKTLEIICSKIFSNCGSHESANLLIKKWYYNGNGTHFAYDFL